jgi:hypothetical protein
MIKMMLMVMIMMMNQMTMMMIMVNSEYMLEVLCNLTCFFDHQRSTYYHRSVRFTLCQCNRYVKQFVV